MLTLLSFETTAYEAGTLSVPSKAHVVGLGGLEPPIPSLKVRCLTILATNPYIVSTALQAALFNNLKKYQVHCNVETFSVDTLSTNLMYIL